MKINVCMLLGLRYGEKMRIAPQIGIASYITYFGHDVTWILSSEEVKEFQETTFNDVRVFVVPCMYSGGILKAITKVLYAIRRMHFVLKNCKNESYNMIFVREGIFDAFLAWYVKKRYKIPFTFERVDPIGQGWEFYKFYHPRLKYFWYFILRINAYLTLLILHKADLVLPTTKWMLEDFAEKGIEKSKMMPFPNGIDINRFSNAYGGEIRNRCGLEDSKVVIYIGTLDKIRRLEVLIHAFSKVRENKKNVKLLMIGDGTDKSNLERLASDLGIKDDLIFTGHVHFDEIPNYIASADIGVSPVPPLDFYKLSSPIKMFEYMAVGKPVVANDEIPEQEEVMRESEGGILVKFEAESFAEGTIELLDNPKKASEMGRRGRKWVVRNRSYEVLARRLEKKYSELVNTYKQGGK